MTIKCPVYNTLSMYNMYYGLCNFKPYEIGVEVACILIKSPLVDEHAFPLTDILSWMAHSTIIFMNKQLCSIKSM